MPMEEHFILMAMGGFFILLGLGGLMWGRSESEDYYDSFSASPDVKEFLERSSEHPQPGALKIGGRIAIILGLVMLAGGGALWFWG